MSVAVGRELRASCHGFPACGPFGHVACEVFGAAPLGCDTGHADLEPPPLDPGQSLRADKHGTLADDLKPDQSIAHSAWDR